MAKFGYVRTSSKQQNVDRQVQSLIEYGVPEKNIYIDQQTGTNFDRPAYQKLKSILREDDTCVFHELDRWGRNFDEGKQEVDWFQRNGIKLIFLDMQFLNEMFESDDLMVRTMGYMQVLIALAIAEKENEKRRKRQAEGVAIAKKQGRCLGRKREFTSKNDTILAAVRDYESGQFTISQICKERNISRSTFYRRVMPLIEEKMMAAGD